MCGIVLEVDGGRIVSVRGDDDDPFSRGHICPKAPALVELHEDPKRLRAPLRRVGSDFVPVGWDAALDEIAARLDEIQRRHGRNAVASYIGNPAVHNHGTALFVPLINRTLRSRYRYSATSADQLPHHLASYFMLGNQLLLPVPDLDRTRFLLMLGANPLTSMGSIMTAPDVKGRLRAMAERGGRVVVVDPRRTETARLASEHVFIRPGTDALFLLGLLQVGLGERGARLGRLAPLARGLEALAAAVREFTPERVAGPTGVGADTIRRLALELWDADPAVVYGRFGACTQPFGAVNQWLIYALNLVTGNFDRPGGAMMTRPAVDALAAAKGVGVGRGSYGRWRSQVRSLPEAGGELPVATLAEEIDAGAIRALLTIAGNPVLSTPNGPQLERALGGLELLVSVDCYVNETTRHANFILPPPSPLERSHYDAALHVVAVRNTAKWSPPVFEPEPGALPEWRILLGLKRRLDALRGVSLRARLENALLGRLGPDGVVDLMLRLGPYGLSLKKLRAAPHGVDLGPLTPVLPDRLPRAHRFIDLAPEPLVADLARARAQLAAAADGLVLVGRRHLRSNNSWMNGLPKLGAGKPRCTLMVHPDDAERCGVGDGDSAEIRSRVGSVRAPVEVTSDMMPGVVSLPHGWGHASLNALTDELLVDPVSGNAAFSGVPVEVRKAGS
jgi:anaerobic selenocysteine-containing dehydrogenase